MSTLRIDGGDCHVAECWSIVADQPLDEVLVELSVDLTPHVRDLADLIERGAALDISYGGELLEESWPASAEGRPVVGVRLPQPLQPQESHEFRLLVSLPSGSAPHRHLHVPAVPCRELAVRVRFDRAEPEAGRPPQGAWLIDSVSLRDVDRWPAPPPSSAPLPLDAVGEFAVVFRSPVPGLAYGIQWSVPATGQ